MTCKDSISATSSLELEDGAARSGSQDGRTLDLFGQAHHLVSPSAQPVKAQALTTPGTCGQFTSTSSASVDLERSLENRLQQLLGTGGSTMFKMTWRVKVTPSQRSYCQLVASAHRTSDNDFGSWQTPMAGSPATDSCNEAGNTDAGRKTRALMGVPLASWATPTTRDHKDTGDMSQSMVRKDGKLRNDTIGRQSIGATSNGSPAPMERPGQLNPRFSGFLMGYSIAWDIAAMEIDTSSRRSSKKPKTE